MLKENNLKPEREITMLYLIMRCDELNDQYECDADRTPIAIVEDWADWIEKNQDIDYSVEIWAYDGTEFKCIKPYTEHLDEGMALCCWNATDIAENTVPTVIEKFPSLTRHDPVPRTVKEIIKKGAYQDDTLKEKGVDDCLTCSGCICWFTKDKKYYVYGEYEDNHYDFGY